jgi:hypothetical protein
MSNATPLSPPSPKTRLFGMQIPEELDALLTESAARHNLTKSGIARLALERGLVVVNEQLSQPERSEA